MKILFCKIFQYYWISEQLFTDIFLFPVSTDATEHFVFGIFRTNR